LKSRTILSFAFAVVFLGGSLLSEAQERKSERVWRIGWLSSAPLQQGRRN
jgi:hypothetical protein